MMTYAERAACVVASYFHYCPMCGEELRPVPDPSGSTHRQCSKCDRCLHCQIHLWLKLDDAQARRT